MGNFNCRHPRWIDDVAIALNDAQEGEELGINRYISLESTGWLGESGHACGAAAVMPVIEDAGAGDVRRPEVAGLDFAAAGLEVSDKGFVELSVKGVAMFILDFSIDNSEPVGGEQGPVAKGFAVGSSLRTNVPRTSWMRMNSAG